MKLVSRGSHISGWTWVLIDQTNETSQNIGLIQRKNARIAASGFIWYKLPEYRVKTCFWPKGTVKHVFWAWSPMERDKTHGTPLKMVCSNLLLSVWQINVIKRLSSCAARRQQSSVRAPAPLGARRYGTQIVCRFVCGWGLFWVSQFFEPLEM